MGCFNPGWNPVVGLLTLAATWCCPVLNASVATGQLTANPPIISFGEVSVGNSQTQSETLTNSKGTSLSISQVWTSGSEFQLSGPSLPLTLASGQSATFNVTFTPTTGGSVVGALSVIAIVSSSQDPNINYNSPLSIPLSGTGTTLPGLLQASYSSISFGSVQVGNSSAQSETLNNFGDSSVNITQANLTGSAFSVNGLSLPVTVIPGQSFTFTPQASGTDTASISFFSNASNSPTVESLSGSGALSPLHSVDLSWSPSTSAVVGYNIYRGGTSGGPYAKINSALNTTIAYTDATAQAGLTYYYVTTAVDASGVESVYSNQAQAVVPTP